MEKYSNKILSGFLIFALIFGQLSAPITALAQEATESAQPSEPTPEATNSATPADDPTPTPTPTPSAAPIEATPSAQPTATPSAQPVNTPSLSDEQVSRAENQKKQVKRANNKQTINQQKNYIEGEVLVKLKTSKVNLKTKQGLDKLEALEDRHNAETITEIEQSNIAVLQADQTTESLVEQLKKDPEVERVEPNYIYTTNSVPSDPKFTDLWGLENNGQTVNGITGKADADIDAPEAWDLENDNQADVIVAVIDTGVAYNHPDLASNMWDGTNCKDDNNNVISGGCPNHGWDQQSNHNNPDDDYGHGTHVAGTIAGISSNGVGISGVSSKNNLKIMALKVNFPKSNSFSSDAIIQSIYFAKNNGAKVINASFGGGPYSQLLKDAIAAFPGLFVAAAGNNDGLNNDQYPHYPSSYDSPNIIAVASTDQKDDLSSFSNYGPTSVDVGAPGSNILSTVLTTLTNEIYFESFDSLTPPAVPNGYTKIGDWGTKVVDNSGSSTDGGGSDIALYGDVNKPYKPNANSTTASPKFDLLNNTLAFIGFRTRCDTQYEGGYTDYMKLEFSKDGQSFEEYARWDEYDLDTANQAPHDPTGYAESYLEYAIPSQYLTKDFKFQFRWISNSSITGDLGLGCFIDVISINLESNGFGYEYYNGTSMATPHVAGQTAMLFSYKPNLTTTQVKDTILNSGDSIPALQGKTVSGKRINLNNALRSNTQSSNADLSNLTISTGALSPSFSPSIASYSAQVANNINTIKVTPTVSDSKSKVNVNGVNLVSGTPSQDINLSVGNNSISIVVTAENQTTKTYTVNVIRAAPDIIAPIITITKSPNKNVHNGPYTITVNFDDAVTKKYKIGSGNLTDYTNSVTVSNEGQHTFYAEGTDSAGNKGTAQVTFEIDITAPSVIISKTPNKDISNSSYTLSVNYSDASIKEYRVNNGNWNQYIEDITISGEGSYTFEARGTDLAGNQTTSQTSFTIDKISPVITINSPAVNARVSGISILQFTVDEQAEVKCSLDNHVFKKCSSGDNFASLDLFNNFIDGPFTVYIQAQDPASNIGTTDRGFIKDTYIPLSPGTPTAQAGPMINAQEYANGFLVVVPLAPDAEIGDLLKVYLNTDHQFISHPLTQQDINSAKYSFAVGSPSLGEDGTKQFKAQITDDLGRTSALSNPLTLILDTQAPQSPTITSVADDNKINALEKQQVKVQGTTEANAWVKLSLTDQISTQSAIVKLTNNNTNYDIAVDSTDLNDGNILTIVSAEDEAGNGSANSFKTVLKDTSFPTLTYVSISSNNANPTKAKLGDTITLQFSASEDLGKDPQVSIHESIIASSKSGDIYTASRVVESTDNEMKATFEINYEDRVGNKGTRVNITTDQSSVTIDKTAPSLQQITAITSPTNNNTPDLTFSSTEAGIISYSGGCSGSQIVASVGNNTITFNPLTDGTYDNCTISVTDEAANISQVLKVNTFTVDTVAPSGILVINNSNKYTNSTKLTLTLTEASSDISKVEIAEGATGSFGNPVSYAGPISYTLQDGVEGQKVVRIRLTDAASNTSGEYSDTIILDTIAPTISNTILTNKTTSNNSYVKDGDILELSATMTDANLADITSSDIKANLSVVGGQVQTNPTSFDQSSGKATWSNIVVSSTTEGLIQVSIDAKDQAGNIAATVTKTVEADNSVPQAKTDYFTTTKNTPILISSALVLANDTDSSGDILLVTQGADFIYTPQADFIGTATLSYTITDGANFATGTIYITVTPDLAENETTLQPVTDLGGQNNKVVVVDVPFESTINVSSDAVNATLDLSNVVTSSETEKTAALSGKININVAVKDLGNLSLQLPETVSISGPVSWNGAIKVPTVLDNSTFTATPSAGMETATTAVVEVGSEDARLVLSKAARLVIPGKKGQLTAYIQAGKVFSITTICAADNQSGGDTLPQDGDCKIDVGSDLVIWTKHFTRFVTYTETALPAAVSSAGGGSSSSSTAPTCTDAKPASAPKLLSAKATSANEVTLTWSKSADPVTYYLVAYGLQKGKMQFGNPNVGGKDTTTYTVKDLSGDTTYYFKVRAGNHCMSGEYSNEIAVKAYGGKISKSAAGFKKGVLSTSKDKQKIQSPASSGAQPASKVLNVIKDFLLKLLSNLQSLSYIPSLRRTHPDSG